MARPRRGPSDEELHDYAARGVTREQVAQEHFEKTGELVKPNSITHLMRKLGLTDTKNRYRETVPWRVKPKHDKGRGGYDLRMLRALGKRLIGELDNDDESRRLDAWLRQRRELHQVVAYDPSLEDGFIYVDTRTLPSEKLATIDPDIPIIRKI